MMNNVVLVNKDQMDHQVIQAEMVIQDKMVMMAHLEVPVLMLKSETNYCLFHLNVHVLEFLDLLDHPANEETMDHQETMAPLETMEDLENQDLLVLPDSLDNPDDLETRDHLENLELFDLDKLHHPADLENLDVPDNLDNPADLEKLAKMVTTADPANLAALDHQVNPDVMANQEAQEKMETLAPQEAAITAHQLVWLLDIRTRYCRGHHLFSFFIFFAKFSRLEKIL